eukprot:m.321559 g.321559  ORF g.321559 m.321559 type:complete len:52 (+) comp16000_c0_seq1:184-339(+)
MIREKGAALHRWVNARVSTKVCLDVVKGLIAITITTAFADGEDDNTKKRKS